MEWVECPICPLTALPKTEIVSTVYGYKHQIILRYNQLHLPLKVQNDLFSQYNSKTHAFFSKNKMASKKQNGCQNSK